MYKIMIIEDEQIERETLYKIIQEGFPECQELYAAKNGKEALTLFEEHHPDIILADINIPGINGLEVIRRIRQTAGEVEFLILSSYNYFEYAQEAIRLGVEDFILKPYTIDHLKDALRKTMEQLQQKQNEKKHQSDLLEKIERITPVVENECLFAILSNEDELVLRKNLRLLSPRICSGFCFIIRSSHYDQTYMEKVSAGFIQLGFRCLKELFHELQIFYILAERAIPQEDLQHLESYITALQSDSLEFGIGPIVNDIALFHHSFQIARDRIGIQEPICSQLLQDSSDDCRVDIDLDKIVARFVSIFQKMDEEGLKRAVHQLCLTLIPHERRQIVQEVADLFERLRDTLQKEYADIDLQRIEIAPLQISTNIYQEVPLYLHMQMHRLYDPIVEERFRNTNQLVRQAVRYIDANYRKQITLSDMADALQVSPFYLSKLLNNSLHKTFTELVSERRVEASKELLKSGKRIKEIAYEVGFQGQNYFTKIFKKYTGVTPKMYKNSFDDK